MIMKGFTMIKNDKKIATLYSCFKNGDIEMWYVVSFDTPLLERD